MVLFDRSWYNRAGVERVMGFATEEQVENFLKYAPAVEKVIIESGIILIKYWLEVDMDEQAKRLQERDEDYRKIWKLSPMDMRRYRRAGTITPGHAMPCLLPPIPPKAPGTWCHPTTSARRG